MQGGGSPLLAVDGYPRSPFTTKVHRIDLERSGKLYGYVNNCCGSDADGIIDVFVLCCWECRGGSFLYHRHNLKVTPPHEMPPKHRQLRAPCPKASANAFQALVDPPHDGNNLSLHGGDEETDESDDNTVVTAPPRDSGPPASPEPQYEPPAIQQWLCELQTSILRSYPREGPIPPGIPQILEVSAATHMLLAYSRDRNMAAHNDMGKRLYKIEERVIALKTDQYRLFDDVNSQMESLLQKMDAVWTKNTALREAYHTSREETAALKVAVDTLTKKLDENTCYGGEGRAGTSITQGLSSFIFIDE
jgi:hypothetical protein